MIKFRFFLFSRKRCGILAFRLRRFTHIGGIYGMAQINFQDFLETFPPDGAKSPSALAIGLGLGLRLGLGLGEG